ncbi:MAG TPA: sterol desaturase family protein [Blastocatellia bacterium]|nr:sterol desaturase family protein [Blastocatellia bacterium]
MKISSRLPAWLTGSLVIGAFGALVWLERRRPLRRQVESKTVRAARNLTIAACGAVALQLAERPVVQPLARRVEEQRLGLLKISRLPLWLEVSLAAALMDYTLYVWHYLMHRVPVLWRFHIVHHIDLDLDASTALRFHFGELLLSVPWRAAQVRLIGVSPLALSVWQTLLLLSVMFHHSNVRLPVEVERRLNQFIVTPRLHGIHHSVCETETDSNWSSGLTLWDWLHGTLRLDVPQSEITIGVPAYRRKDEVTLPQMLALPFGHERPAWQLPGNGLLISRPPTANAD